MFDAEDPIVKLMTSPQRRDVLAKVATSIVAGEDVEKVLTDNHVTHMEAVLLWNKMATRTMGDFDLAKRMHPVFGPIILHVFSPVFKRSV